jgi:hypothetical protein
MKPVVQAPHFDKYADYYTIHKCRFQGPNKKSQNTSMILNQNTAISAENFKNLNFWPQMIKIAKNNKNNIGPQFPKTDVRKF